ncbi:MAG: hypothetical protein B7Z66_14535 [Chromatiales bacterium 21-64-14]|nr:MAG: hypothetical protein B7Z66_14535 [Chromatiales bacterium 21-64-14]
MPRKPLEIDSRFLPSGVSKNWLIAGAAAEFSINTWTFWFVYRMRSCDHGQRRKRLTLQAAQAAMLLLLVSFVAALAAERPKLASWLAAAFFATALTTALLMRSWLHGIPGVPDCGRVTKAEFIAVDAVNWMAFLGFAIKIAGLVASLWVAATI